MILKYMCEKEIIKFNITNGFFHVEIDFRFIYERQYIFIFYGENALLEKI